MITVKDIEKAAKYPNACKDSQGRLRVGAAVGTGAGTDERVAALVEAGVDLVTAQLGGSLCGGVGNWDDHPVNANCFEAIRYRLQFMDKAVAALVEDIQDRGLNKRVLVVVTGEFGRTPMSQGKTGRDHSPFGFSAWMAGGGIRKGHVHGETDDFCYNIVRDPVHINDLNATVLQCLGLDHERFTYRYQGLDQRLTSVQGARVVNELLA